LDEAGVIENISPHSLRHSFIAAALDAGVPLRDVQIAARHADPRTTTRCDRARNNLDRTPATSWPPLSQEAPDAGCPQHWSRHHGVASFLVTPLDEEHCATRPWVLDRRGSRVSVALGPICRRL
jgi:hypothetical protein